jgi:hypothetical protein
MRNGFPDELLDRLRTGSSPGRLHATGRDAIMTTGEELYLAMVIAAVVLFGVTLAWVSMFRK